MARYECQRCKAICFTTEDPHLCADLKSRYARQQKAIYKIQEIDPDISEEIALKIIKAISGLKLEDTL